MDIHLLEVDGLSLLPPGEDRVLVAPERCPPWPCPLVNSGTSNLTLLPTLTGLPSDVEVSYDVSEVNLAPGAQENITLSFAASTGATPASSALTLAFQDGPFNVTTVLSWSSSTEKQSW